MSVYNIAVRMTMTNQVSPILNTIAHDLLGIHRHTINAAGGMNNIRNAVMGLGAAWAGTKIVEGVGKLIDHGGKFLNIQNQMEAGSWKQLEIAEATAKARELSLKYQTISAREILDMQKEMAPVLGDKHHAMEMAESMTKLMVALQFRNPEKAHAFHSEVRSAVRAGELSANALTPKRFEEYLEGMAKALNAFNGTVTPTMYMQATKYGRSSAISWSDRFTAQVLPTIIQELGAQSTGTAFMSMFQAVQGGQMTQRARDWFQRMGLVDEDKAKRLGSLTPEGRLKRLLPGLISGAGEMASDPDLWMEHTVIPALKRKGIINNEQWKAIEDGQIKEGVGLQGLNAIRDELAIGFGNRTAQGIANLLAFQVRKLKRDATLVTDSMGLTKTSEMWQRDYLMQKNALAAQWENLQDALSLPNLPAAVEALRGFNNVIAGLAKLFADHPDLSRFLMSGAMAGGLVLVLAGIGALIATFAGPAVLAAAGITALAVGIGSLIALRWEKIRQNFSAGGVVNYVFRDMVGDIAVLIKNAFFGLPNMLASTIGPVFYAIGGMIRDAFWSLLPNLKKMFGLDGSWKGGPGTPYAAPEAAPGVGPDGMPLLQQQRYVPGSDRGRMIQTRTTINLDGRTLADVVAMQIARMAEHATGGMGFDRQMQPMLPDNSIPT